MTGIEVSGGVMTAFAARPERIVVLTRQGCHLCEEAIAQVAAVCVESARRTRCLMSTATRNCSGATPTRCP